MDSLRDAQDQTTEIVSTSLIKSPPSNVNWNECKDFHLGLDPEWQWPYTENVPPEPVQPNVEREGDPGIKKPRLSLSLKKANRVGCSEGSELRATTNITNTEPHITADVLQN